MGPLITLILAMARLTIQKSLVDISNSKIIELPGSPELETMLQNLLTQNKGSYYKDVNLKINPNKRLSDGEAEAPSRLSERIPGKESNEFITGLNTKLGKVIDGLQHRVMDENTNDPTCSCDYVGKRWPGVIKCECQSDADNNSNEGKRKDKDDKKSKDRRNEVKIKEVRQPSKFDSNDASRCGCQLLRNKDKTHDLRCKCGGGSGRVLRSRLDRDDGYWSDDTWSWSREDDSTEVKQDEILPSVGRNYNEEDGYWSDDTWSRHDVKPDEEIPSLIIGRSNDRDDGYWSDDNWCECALLRSSEDNKGTHDLRCNCKSPGRIGDNIKVDRDDGYWSDDNWCECGLLRSSEDNKGTYDLRCNCKSPARVGHNIKDDQDDGYWSDDNWCECGLLRSSEDNKGTYDLRCNCNSPARVGSNIKDYRNDGYWSDDNWCECGLRSSDKDKSTHDLSCRCNSPARTGDNRGDNKDGYWLDDNRCGCTLLRSSSNDNTFNLRCRCDSPARMGSKRDDNRNDGYWSDDNWCECGLRSSDNDKSTHDLRCRCNSPARTGDNRGDNKDGYWLDDNRCGCTLLRSSSNDNTFNLRCRCDSPAREGNKRDDNKNDGYWSDDNWCECGLLRSSNDKGTRNLRCRCNSGRAGYDETVLGKFRNEKQLHGAKLSDLSDIENDSKNVDNFDSDDQSINTLLNYILKKENDVDVSKLPKMKKKIIEKLRDIMPSLRNIDNDRLKKKIVSILFDKNAERMPNSKESPDNVKVVKIMLQPKKDTEFSRRQMVKRSFGAPFTVELEALAQLNV